MPLFEVVIVEHPKKKKGEDQELEKIVFPKTMVVARDKDDAVMSIVMDNADAIKKLNRQRMEVLVRPFG